MLNNWLSKFKNNLRLKNATASIKNIVKFSGLKKRAKRKLGVVNRQIFSQCGIRPVVVTCRWGLSWFNQIFCKSKRYRTNPNLFSYYQQLHFFQEIAFCYYWPFLCSFIWIVCSSVSLFLFRIQSHTDDTDT